MTDPRVPLKNPWLAVFLGLLLPGGGQLYQGRTFKGVLYAVCITGSFTYGMFLSDWTALYAGSPLSSTGRRWGYLAQAPIGAPAMYALVQQRRYGSEANVPQFVIEGPLSAPFEGRMMLENGEAAAYYQLRGTVELEPGTSVVGPIAIGRFIGEQTELDPATLKPKPETAQEAEYVLSSEAGRFELDRPVYADRQRSLKIPVVEESAQGRAERIGVLRGTIPRPVSNWLAVPLEPEKVNRLHYELGKTYDLALVYTWIAALLNVLVLWDAFEGPAYGYGDEKSEGDADGAKPEGGPKPEKDPAPAA